MVKDMTQGKEWKLILSFTLPLIGGNLLQQVYSLADSLIVGNFAGQTARWPPLAPVFPSPFCFWPWPWA